jgi:hypothetical protein
MQAWVRILLEPEGGNATVNGWRMASAKSFFDALLPGSAPAALVLYLLVSLALLAALARLWTRPSANLPVVWLFTCLVAVLVDPHLVDYDLTVLVAGAVVAASMVRPLAWAIIPLYLITLLRAAVPLGDVASLQLTAPLLLVAAIWTWTFGKKSGLCAVGQDGFTVGPVPQQYQSLALNPSQLPMHPTRPHG